MIYPMAKDGIKLILAPFFSVEGILEGLDLALESASGIFNAVTTYSGGVLVRSILHNARIGK